MRYTITILRDGRAVGRGQSPDDRARRVAVEVELKWSPGVDDLSVLARPRVVRADDA